MPGSSCRYGYLYGLQPVGVTSLAFTDVRQHKPKTKTAPAMDAMADYYLYTVDQNNLERFLLGKHTTLNISPATYASARLPGVVTIVSPLPMTSLDDVIQPQHLDDYLAHRYACDTRGAISGFVDRNNTRAQREYLRRLYGLSHNASDDELIAVMTRTASDALDLMQPSDLTRSFVDRTIFPELATSWALSSIAENDGTLNLTWGDDDLAVGEATGVVSLHVSSSNTHRASATYEFVATMRPDANDYPAVVVNHARGIAAVVPLLDPTSPVADGKEVIQDWAEAIPVVGQVAKAAVTSAYHFKNRSAVMPTLVTGKSVVDNAVSISIQPPSWDDFPSALTAADTLAATAGLSFDNRKELNQRILNDAATGIPAWRYRSYVDNEIHQLIQRQEMGKMVTPPPAVPRGTAHDQTMVDTHTTAPATTGTPQRFSDIATRMDEMVSSVPAQPDDSSQRITISLDDVTSITMDDSGEFLQRYATLSAAAGDKPDIDHTYSPQPPTAEQLATALAAALSTATSGTQPSGETPDE